MNEEKKILKDIGFRLQLIRKAMNIQQKDFAVDLGISNSSLSVIESGKAKPRFELIYNISRTHNINIYYLLYGHGEMFMPDNIERAIRNNKNEDSADFFRDLLYYFKVSPLVKFKVMSFFREYIAGHDELIEKDIKRSKQANKT